VHRRVADYDYLSDIFTGQAFPGTQLPNHSVKDLLRPPAGASLLRFPHPWLSLPSPLQTYLNLPVAVSQSSRQPGDHVIQHILDLCSGIHNLKDLCHLFLVKLVETLLNSISQENCLKKAPFVLQCLKPD
jgi:hypothetical protein